MQENTKQDAWKRLAAEEAVNYIRNDMVIGIGTGSTAAHMVRVLARRLQEGLSIKGAVPTSRATEELARSLGIPLTDLDASPELDIAIDGADEIDEHLYLIKGGGGALLREKIVATASKRFLIIADKTKLVSRLGLTAPLPVEVIPFGATPVRRHLETLGARVEMRARDGRVFFTDNGNVILDCYFSHGIADPEGLEGRISRFVGVVETGLFLHMAERAIIGDDGGIEVIS